VGLKEDADFARYLSMGAMGSAVVAERLRDEHGHQPIELERTAMSNKVWQTKVKRLRLPDILCLHCGLRVESRAKSKVGIILSHSEAAGREWHAGGLRDNDLYGFTHVNVNTDPPTIGPSLFLTRAELNATSEHARLSGRKAASAGAEVSLTWPAYVATSSGTLTVVAGGNGPNLVIQDGDARARPYWQWLRWPQRHLYVPEGGSVVAGQTVVAGVVQPPASLACPGKVWDPAQDLFAQDEIDRYVAVKAAGFLVRDDLVTRLREIAHDETNDWRLRLEADASLARIGEVDPIDQIAGAVFNDTTDDVRIEAVFVLSELDADAAVDALHTIALAEEVPSEVRSAAAWGLGQGVRAEPARAVDLIADEDDLVALHAIAAIQQVDDHLAARLRGQLAGEPRLAEASAVILLRHNRVGELFDAALAGGEPALLGLRALGDVSPQALEASLGGEAVEKLRPVVEPLWRGQADWIRHVGAEGLEALDAQRVHSGPSF